MSPSASLKQANVRIMGVQRPQHYLQTIITAFVLLFIASASASIPSLSHQLNSGTGGSESFMSRRRLVGPGSSPPSCQSKCGKCTPCRPVHVPIQPGVFVPLEYYPEAWRCKCHNKLYMP